MVRDFFASTTVVLLVDIVFLVLFLVLITVLAGWLVLVPIVGIALMLIAGVSLQKAMGRAALDAQADSSLQHSVLVESIAGAETLKAARAEGQMLGRWRRYSAMSAATQERMRRLTAVAVNLASVSPADDQRRPADRRLLPFNEGEMTMGAIIAIVMLAGPRDAPIGQFAFLITRARQAFDDARFAAADDGSAPTSGRSPLRSIVPEIRAGHIELTNVGFRYPERGARQPRRTSTSRSSRASGSAIIGRVASGKSTLGRRAVRPLCADRRRDAGRRPRQPPVSTRTSCARRSASSARTPNCSAARCATI